MKKLPVKIISILLIILCGIGYYFYQQKSSSSKTFDNFPVWLLRDGKVSVYQEVTIGSGKYERKVVVNNLGGEDQKGVKVYVEIPKEIAQKVSDITFSSKVEIIKDDPFVLWDVGEPGKTTAKEMSWTDTALVLPRAVGLALTWSRDIAMNNLTDVCKTQTAREWIEKNTWMKDKTSFLACGEYMEHIEKVIQERTAKDWQNKTDENRIEKIIEPTDSLYAPVKKKAKEIIKKETHLSPAGNLAGTWSGSATFQNTENPQNYCTFTGNLELKINSQSNNEINGQFFYTTQKAVPHGGGTKCKTGTTDKYQVRAVINGSRLENMSTVDTYGVFNGSFTGDTLTLNQSQITSLKLIGPANLLRR